jgi:hypothetical protein
LTFEIKHDTNMKKTIFIALTLAFTLTGCKKQTFEDRVIADVEHFNTKEAPKHMDVYTTLDSMNYDKSTQTIGYYYTVNGIADDVELFPAAPFRQQLLQNVRSSLQLKPHKEHGCNFRYCYLSQTTGRPLLDVTFTPEDYK